MANIDKAFEVETLSLGNNALITSGSIDPSVTGYEAPLGSLYVRSNVSPPHIYIKHTAPDTGWQPLIYGVGTQAQILTTENNEAVWSNPVLAVNGHTDRSQTTFSFDNPSRTLTISPTDTSFDFWSESNHYVKTSPQSTVIANAEGISLVYFDATGTLVSINNPPPDFSQVFLKNAPVALIYWDTTNNQAIFIADERHGRAMSNETHIYLHETRGAVAAAGSFSPTITLTADGTGTAASDVQIGLPDGTLWDEDLDHIVVNRAITLLDTLVGGSGYVSGSYTDVPLTGGTGTGATADIIVSGGIVIMVTIVNRGTDYTLSDVLTTPNTNLGGTGAGFSITATNVLQTIRPVVQAPFYYRTGVAGDWRRLAATGFILPSTGSGRAAHNLFSGGLWSLAEVPDGKFCFAHLIATNEFNNPVVCILGQTIYDDIASARTGAEFDLINIGFGAFSRLTFEWAPLFTLIVETSNSFSNAIKSRVRKTSLGEDYLDWRASNFRTILSNAFALSPLVRNVWVGTFLQSSGTTTIPVDNTTPLITEGTEVMSLTITPKSSSSRFVFLFSAMADNSTPGAYTLMSAFRNSACIGVSAIEFPTGTVPSHGKTLTLNLTDSPNTASSVTYSVRAGQSGGGAWYMAQLGNANFGGDINNGWCILEI